MYCIYPYVFDVVFDEVLLLNRWDKYSARLVFCEI